MTFGSLFAGIGGMDLGLERAGMTCKFQVEIDPFARRVLAKHWPDIPRHDDVKTFPPGDDLDPWRVDLIAGGFPCQDISYAGKGAGLSGERSGLWAEYARIIRVLRPRYVLVENVSALLVRGLDSVLGTLASMGYDAEWGCISAASVGAPHGRDRVFLVASTLDDPDGQRLVAMRSGRDVDDAEIRGRDECSRHLQASRLSGGGPHMADPDRQRKPQQERIFAQGRGWLVDFRETVGLAQWRADPADATQSGVGRMADGVPDRVDRMRTLGNSVVPQVAEFIGRLIMEAA